MQASPSLGKKGVKLFRVCYKLRETGAVHRPIGFHAFEVAEEIVANFNARYAEHCEYFLEPVNIKSLSEDTLINLVQQEKLSPKEARRYLPINALPPSVG
ncbi:MAG TPA: hypothetical protein V6C84_30420 [Coleofasciculaceae cyanobacterium]|jgi:hypothetical protein